jgi:hypothetical protein
MRRRRERRNRKTKPAPPPPDFTPIAPEAYYQFPIPDTRNDTGEYIGPTDFVSHPFETEYDPFLPGLDFFGKVTVADLLFLEFVHQKPLMFPPEKREEQEVVTRKRKATWNLNPEPENKSLMKQSFEIHMKDKYYPLIVVSCSGAVNSVFELTELKETFQKVLDTKGNKPFDLVLDVKKVTFCTTAAMRGFYDQLISLNSTGFSWASTFFSRVCIVVDKEHNKSLDELIMLVAASRVLIKDEKTRSIPFARVTTNKQVEEFRARTKPFFP